MKRAVKNHEADSGHGTRNAPSTPGGLASAQFPELGTTDRHEDPVVYIAGMGRSGSTLLERLLANQPGWWAAGELVHLWNRAVLDNEMCGCGVPFKDCPEWSAIGKAAFGGWDRVDAEAAYGLQQRVARDRHLARLSFPGSGTRFDADTLEYTALFRRIYQAIREVTGAAVVVDSSKHVTTALALKCDDEINLKVVHLVRDPRAVAFSWGKVVPRPASGGGTVMTRWSPLEVSLRYLAYNTILTWMFRGDRILVRYEDYISRATSTVEKISQWARAASAPIGPHLDSATAIDLPISHGISGNPSRFNVGRVQLSLDDEWLRKMKPGERRLVTSLTFPSLIQFGYVSVPDHVGLIGESL